MKLHTIEARGAINVEWDKNSQFLTCRVITKGKNRPNLIIGDFVDYLLANHRNRIQTISLIPR